MRLPTFYEQNLIPNWGLYGIEIVLRIQHVGFLKGSNRTFMELKSSAGNAHVEAFEF